MPRRMPRFDLRFAAQAQVASEIVVAGEKSSVTGDEWTPKRLEFLYELAYLRVFASWEATLESIFYRSLCGYASRAGQESMVSGVYYASIAKAEVAVLAAESRGKVVKTYVLWHSAMQIISRCKTHIVAGTQESVISSNRNRLDALAAVRHRIVHDQQDAKVKFDKATLFLVGKTYPASRPGKFLRDLDRHSARPHRKWMDSAISELTGLSGQMV